MWYTTFFHGLPQVAWRAAQTDEQTQAELELLVETLDFGPGDRLLDVFCGYGRHALPLARLGANVVGVDISAEYVADLRQTAQADRLPIHVVEADFLLLDRTTAGSVVAAPFDAAYCLGNSFSFFPPAQMQTFLAKIAGALRPGGRFLAQSGMVAEVVLPDFQERSWLAIDPGLTVLVEHDYVAPESRIEQRLTYLHQSPGGTQIETRTAQHYVYTTAELLRLCREAGLSVLGTFGTVDGQPFLLGDEALWLLAERP